MQFHIRRAYLHRFLFVCSNLKPNTNAHKTHTRQSQQITPTMTTTIKRPSDAFDDIFFI